MFLNFFVETFNLGVKNIHLHKLRSLLTTLGIIFGVSAVISDLRVNPPVIRTAGDNVNANDVAYNKVMPYAATPNNGRVRFHD